LSFSGYQEVFKEQKHKDENINLIERSRGVDCFFKLIFEHDFSFGGDNGGFPIL
jgi:hypothetical protein